MRSQTSIVLEPQEDAVNVTSASSVVCSEGEFEAVVKSYTSGLLHFITRILASSGDEAQAEDVLQHVLLQLYLCWPRLKRENRSLRPWLYRVAYNRCLDEIRARQRRHLVYFSYLEQEVSQEDTSPLATLLDPSPLPEDVAEQHELARLLQAAISELPPKYRIIVTLRSARQLSFEEIGATLTMHSSTVKTYFYRARPLLRMLLTQEHEGECPEEGSSVQRGSAI